MPKYKLADYRYGREEMLALYVKENKVGRGPAGDRGCGRLGAQAHLSLRSPKSFRTRSSPRCCRRSHCGRWRLSP